MLKILTEKLKQKKAEKQELKLKKEHAKPQFTLGNLYVGEIVLYKKREDIGFGKVDHYYNEVKKFAVFTKTGYNEYRHIKSGQKLYDMCSSFAVTGDYAVYNVIPLSCNLAFCLVINRIPIQIKSI